MYDIRKNMTKKAYKELQKKNRVSVGFNTGVRTMKTAKNPSRQFQKNSLQKMIYEL